MVREREGEFGREATETDGARVSWVRCIHVATSGGATESYRRWRVSFGMAPSKTSPDGLQILSPLGTAVFGLHEMQITYSTSY